MPYVNVIIYRACIIVMLCELQDGDDADLLSQRHISEIYYLWKLAGGDLEGSLRKAGLIRQHPPITQLPLYVS